MLLSIPASLGLIIASEEIVNALFGYGSFSYKDVKMTSDALTFFGYGVIAFALVKILAKGKISSPLKVSAHKFSIKAQKEIESAGGLVKLILKSE